MFSFLKKKEAEKNLAAFCNGKVKPVEEVKDQIFSSKMLGEGIAIEPTEGMLYAPAAGEVTVVMDGSFHAVGLKLPGGMELLLHIGLDTVELNGKGFTPYVKQGDKVNKGDRLIGFDRDIIKQGGYSDDVILVITNSGNYPDLKMITGIQAEAGKTVIAEWL